MSVENTIHQQKEPTQAHRFGSYLQHDREASGESLEERAQTLGMEPQVLVEYERGDTPIPEPWIVAGWSNKLGNPPVMTIEMLEASGHLSQSGEPLARVQRPPSVDTRNALFDSQNLHRRFRTVVSVLKAEVARRRNRG